MNQKITDCITISFRHLPQKIILHFYSVYWEALHIHHTRSPTTEASHHPNKMDLKYDHNIYNVYKTAQYIKFPS